MKKQINRPRRTVSKGTTFYKAYRKDTIPDEPELQDDLAKMMAIYRDYVKSNTVEEENPENTDDKPEEPGGEEELTVKETINRIKSYIEAKGLSYPDCSGVAKMSDNNKLVFDGTKEEVIEMGYSPCGICKP